MALVEKPEKMAQLLRVSFKMVGLTDGVDKLKMMALTLLAGSRNQNVTGMQGKLCFQQRMVENVFRKDCLKTEISTKIFKISLMTKPRLWPRNLMKINFINHSLIHLAL